MLRHNIAQLRSGEDHLSPPWNDSLPDTSTTPPPSNSLPQPRSLSIRFANATDAPDICTLFHTSAFERFGTKGFVIKRSVQALFDACAKGEALIIRDEQNNIRSFGIVERRSDPQKPEHDFLELGSFICDARGLGLHELSMALRVIKFYAHEHSQQNRSLPLHAKAVDGNHGVHKRMSERLRWKRVTDPTHSARLYRGVYGDAASPRNCHWYEQTDETVQAASGIVTHLYRAQAVFDKKASNAISVDLSDLEL